MPKKVPDPKNIPVPRKWGNAVRGAGGFVVDVPQKLSSLKSKLAVDDSGNPAQKPKKVDVDYVVEGGQNLSRAVNRAPVKTYTGG